MVVEDNSKCGLCTVVGQECGSSFAGWSLGQGVSQGCRRPRAAVARGLASGWGLAVGRGSTPCQGAFSIGQRAGPWPWPFTLLRAGGPMREPRRKLPSSSGNHTSSRLRFPGGSTGPSPVHGRELREHREARTLGTRPGCWPPGLPSSYLPKL